jgi:WD40 repeat protein
LESFNLLYVQRQVLFCENGKKVVLFGSGENIYFYQSSNGKKINSLKVKDRGMLWGLADLPVKDISISPDAKYLASTIGLKETIQIWELKNNSLWKTLSGHESGINSIEYSSDGAFLASASDDGTIKLWDSETGQLIRTLDNHRNGIKDTVFSSDGELLIAGSSKGQITVWETKSGKLVKQLNGHTDEITMVCSTVDDEMIATSSKDNTVRIWNIPTGACTKAFGHDDNVLGIAFSRDGTILVSLTKNEKLYFWFAGTGKLITSFATEARTVITSPDGKMVIGVGMKSLIIYGVKRKEK